MLLKQQPDLLKLEAIETLQKVWQRHYTRNESGEVGWRKTADLSRAATAIESPYDIEARYSNKRQLSWTGYKVHLTETCDTDLPRLITNVLTTAATEQDVACTALIHQSLKQNRRLPGRHFVDAGYVDAGLLADSSNRYAVELFGPTRLNPSWQKRVGGYDQAQFQIERLPGLQQSQQMCQIQIRCAPFAKPAASIALRSIGGDSKSADN